MVVMEVGLYYLCMHSNVFFNVIMLISLPLSPSLSFSLHLSLMNLQYLVLSATCDLAHISKMIMFAEGNMLYDYCLHCSGSCCYEQSRANGPPLLIT